MHWYNIISYNNNIIMIRSFRFKTFFYRPYFKKYQQDGCFYIIARVIYEFIIRIGCLKCCYNLSILYNLYCG